MLMIIHDRIHCSIPPIVRVLRLLAICQRRMIPIRLWLNPPKHLIRLLLLCLKRTILQPLSDKAASDDALSQPSSVYRLLHPGRCYSCCYAYGSHLFSATDGLNAPGSSSLPIAFEISSAYFVSPVYSVRGGLPFLCHFRTALPVTPHTTPIASKPPSFFFANSKFCEY